MNELEQRAFEMEAKVKTASASERLSIQPQFEKILSRLAAHGHKVPTRLRQLNYTLKEEAIEDMFDNLPV